ncbi:unnamed protein product [Calicophoron daubneyi]|uniref:Uncharacterized protein n=1 Tax=Calicophoron daubneyi TaxID=300641 RepID=A0AAV2TCQ6_CALDB
MHCFPWLVLATLWTVVDGGQVESVSVYPTEQFPIELGQSVKWTFTPRGGSEYHPDSFIGFELGNEKAYRAKRTGCSGPLEKYFSCTYKADNEVIVTFTPTEEHYGLELRIIYYKNLEALWLGTPPLLRETIQVRVNNLLEYFQT